MTNDPSKHVLKGNNKVEINALLADVNEDGIVKRSMASL